MKYISQSPIVRGAGCPNDMQGMSMPYKRMALDPEGQISGMKPRNLSEINESWSRGSFNSDEHTIPL